MIIWYKVFLLFIVVTRPAPIATPKPAQIRPNTMSTSRMKHSSKEQVKQQAVKAKSRKGGGVPVLQNKKYMTMESRQDLNRQVQRVGCNVSAPVLVLYRPLV